MRFSFFNEDEYAFEGQNKKALRKKCFFLAQEYGLWEDLIEKDWLKKNKQKSTWG